MIIRSLEQILGSDREVETENWTSRRLLLRQDGMGFSLHDTVVRAGTETFMWYKHHLEAVYCIEGRGEVEDLDTGEIHALEPGTVYALDGNDRHVLRARERMRMICVFNPALSGLEVHDETGTYPLVDDDGAREGGRDAYIETDDERQIVS